MSDLKIEIIKTDLKNDIESGMLNPQQQLIAINTALRDLAGLDDGKYDEVIKKYRDAQKDQEDVLEKAQSTIMENAKNIYEHLIKDL